MTENTVPPPLFIEHEGHTYVLLSSAARYAESAAEPQHRIGTSAMITDEVIRHRQRIAEIERMRVGRGPTDVR